MGTEHLDEMLTNLKGLKPGDEEESKEEDREEDKKGDPSIPQEPDVATATDANTAELQGDDTPEESPGPDQFPEEYEEPADGELEFGPDKPSIFQPEDESEEEHEPSPEPGSLPDKYEYIDPDEIEYLPSPEPGPEEEPLASPSAKNKATDDIRTMLLGGYTQDEIIASGYHPKTVATTASTLKKETGIDYGKRKQKTEERALVTRDPAEIQTTEPPGPPAKRGGRALEAATPSDIKTFAKATPPEAIINAVKIPEGVPALQQFENGVKFGLEMLVLGVRMSQELTSIGVSQAQPLIKLAGEMREGEKQAAKGLAGEAADNAVRAGMGDVVGALQAMDERLSELETPIEQEERKRSGLPPHAQKMINKMTERISNKMMDMVMPGYSQEANKALPEDWTEG